nr:MAG TPA: hypothetical protein [Caudoviricetes sp.]
MLLTRNLLLVLLQVLYWVRCIIILHSKIILNIYLTSRL